MSSEVLADQAVSLLHKLFTANLPDDATPAATTLLELVEDGLAEPGQVDRLEEFHADPTDDTRRNLADALGTRLDQDGFYRNTVARQVDKTLRAVKRAVPVSVAPARDANGNLVRDDPDGAGEGPSFFDGEVASA